MRLQVSAIIPAHNAAKTIARCLTALQGSQPRPDEIIVVDDCSTDGTGETARALGARVLRTSAQVGAAAQVGPAAARNQGAEAATGDLLFFVDADVVVHADALARALDALGRDGSLTACFGSYDDAPPEPDFLSQYKNLFHHAVHQAGHDEATTFWAGCGVIRRVDFLAVGGFDADRYSEPSIEDIELGYRLIRAGRRIRLCKQMQATHLKRWTAGSLLRTDVCRRAVPWTLLLLREGRLPNDLNLRRTDRVSTIAVYLLLISGWSVPRRQAARCVGAIAVVLLLAVNYPLYRFFHRRRGARFTALAILWHWFYFLYSGFSFALGLLRHAAGDRRHR